MIPNNHIKNEAQNKSKVLTLREEEHFTILFAGDTSFGENYLIKNKEDE